MMNYLISYFNFNLCQQEHQQLIIDAGALPCLVELLRRHKSSTFCIPAFGILRRVADTIKYLAFGNPIVKTLVRLFSFFHTLKIK